MIRLQSASIAVLLSFGSLAAGPTASQAQIAVGVSVGIAPPPLPIYAQPPIPGYGYVWTPGYWGWNAGVGDYYWSPGDWVQPPAIGLLWTPAWWGWNNGAYLFNAGYWGPTVGFYGGINYGFGYGGYGYQGGYWRGRNFYYNRGVNNLSGVHITNVYNRTVINRGVASRVSFNGGKGGVAARPTAAELAAGRQRHTPATAAQVRDSRIASADKTEFWKNNHGAPPVAAKGAPQRTAAASVAHAATATKAGSSHATGAHHATTGRHGGASRHHASHGRHGTSSHHYSHSYTHSYSHSYSHASGHSSYARPSSFGGGHFGAESHGMAAPHMAGPSRGGEAPRGGGGRPHG